MESVTVTLRFTGTENRTGLLFKKRVVVVVGEGLEKKKSKHYECQSDFHIHRCKCFARWKMFPDGVLAPSTRCRVPWGERRKGRSWEDRWSRLRQGQIARMILKTQSGRASFGWHSVATKRQDARPENLRRATTGTLFEMMLDFYGFIIVYPNLGDHREQSSALGSVLTSRPNVSNKVGWISSVDTGCDFM